MTVHPNRPYPLLFILFFVTYAYFFQGGGWNQNIRICEVRALLHEHSLSINAYKEDSREPFCEFVNSGDWAYRDGHYYSNKSQGLSLLAFVPFGIMERVAAHFFPGDPERQVYLGAFAANLVAVVLCSALLCLLLFYFFTSVFSFPDTYALLLTVCFGLGTLAFPYSTIFYSHLPAAFFSFLAFVLVLRAAHGRTAHARSSLFFSGVASSCAVLLEPSCIFIVVCLFCYLLVFPETRRYGVYFVLGGVPGGLVQLYVNSVCFGGPLASGYDYANDAVMFRVNGKLFGFPRPGNIAAILFLPNRGLFVTSPALVMAAPGIFLLLGKRSHIAEALLCVSVSAVFLLFIVSYFAWHHASTPGPRYLLPAFPFMFVLAAYACRQWRTVFALLGVAGIVINLVITLVGNEIPHDIDNPLTDFILKNALAGKVSVNPAPFSNFENYNIAELAVTDQWPQNFNAFNMGEFLFPHSVLSILPLVLFWLVWVYCWKRVMRQ